MNEKAHQNGREGKQNFKQSGCHIQQAARSDEI